MGFEKRLYADMIELKYFRSFKDVTIPLGRKMTIISGVNGVGKSNIISLVSSGSGISKKSSLGSNFQPEFSEFFNIDESEDYPNYKIYIKYIEENGTFALTKRLSFKDDTQTNRGIRIIPRTAKEFSNFITIKDAENEAKEKYGVGGAGRVLIPTIYLSLSRLYPLGECKGTVTVSKVKKGSPYAQKNIMDKYREWYNRIIPGAVSSEANYLVIKKQACSRASLHMDIDKTPTLSQSIGQDNIGNIVSALVDIYRLSLEEGYNGAILCIDEIEVSLHPDTQVNLIDLLDSLAGELKIQIIVSTHSLTVLKECLNKEKKNEKDFRVVYLKDTSAPYVTERKSYDLLKADMLGKLQFKPVKVKMYFEDDIGNQLFVSLMDAYKYVYQKVESDGGKALRHLEAVEDYTSILERIRSLKRALAYKDQINNIVTHIGCDMLLRISMADSYFDRVIIMLDGDARLKTNKPRIRDYLDVPFDPHEHQQNEIAHKPNIMFAPGFFAPESFLFKIIRDLYTETIENTSFWRGMDSNETTALYTADKIRNLFSSLPADFNNDNLKKIIGEEVKGEVWDFIIKSDLLSYYYCDYRMVDSLLSFVEKFIEAFKMTYPLTLSNRYS